VVRPEDKFKRAGQGDWEACPFSIEQLLTAATAWKAEIGEVRRAWLCWNVDHDWCFVQQLLAESVGWTPVVGYDPRVGPPDRLTPNAKVIDFNRALALPIHYPHIPIELAFAWIDTLAFWHADFLIRPHQLEAIANRFGLLEPGQMSAVPTRTLRTAFTPMRERYWELIGCTTSRASRSQFDHGCGWWMNFWRHPNHSGTSTAERYNWDHGGGIVYWEREAGGEILEIPLGMVEEGHFSVINNPNYKRSTTESAHYHRNLSAELSANYQLDTCCKKLGIDPSKLIERVFGEAKQIKGISS
jgi:hypothetical protein